MFGWFKKTIKKEVIVPPPPPEIKIGEVYILRYEKEESKRGDPWGIGYVTRARVCDVKSGWVRYFYIWEDGRKIGNYKDEVKLVEDFNACYEIDEDFINGNL